MSKPTKRTVLITGCSDNSLGSSLSLAFHHAGYHVYATSRTTSKMTSLTTHGIETFELDILSETSLATAVARIPALDILVNNAGTVSVMPFSDMSIPEAKKHFDINFWAHLAVVQAFLPALMKSDKGMVVNQTSVASVTQVPFQAAYSGAKAAMAAVSNVMRLELQAFGIKVIELKTAFVQSNLINNNQASNPNPRLPEGSIWEPAKEVVERALRQESFVGKGMRSEQWAELVVRDLMRGNPPKVIWRGEGAVLGRVAALLPVGFVDRSVKRLVGLDKVEQILKN